MRKLSPLLFRFSVGLLWILLAGCALGNAGSLSTRSAGTFPVDPQLKSFYAKGGGLDVFGPAISEVTIQEYIRCQLMENARICVNTNQSGTGKFTLSPLGRLLGIPINSGVESSAIFPDFVPLIAQLGEENVGPALDKVRYNYQESRVEQYFENVGFYHGIDEPAGTVHLLPYGDFVCGSACMYEPSISFTPLINIYGNPFELALLPVGGESFSGIALTPAYQTGDGYLEQVFTNIVVASLPDNPETFWLLPVPEIIDIPNTPPVIQQYDLTDNMVFIEVQDDMGYHVPIPLDNFMSMHGGNRLAGKPISEIVLIENKNIYRQCFETYCLDYNPNAAEAYKVLPAPLGQVYLDIVKPVIPGGTIQPEDVTLTSREAKTRIAAGENQTIQIGLSQKSNNQAIPGMGAHLVVRTSDGRLVFEKDFPLTDASGNASISMDAMTGMMNGDLLMYQVCLAGNTTTPICVNGSFLIWD